MRLSYKIALFTLSILFTFHITNTCDRIVQIKRPHELKKYLTKEKTGDNIAACALHKKFSTDDIKPFINALAAMPSDISGNTAKNMLLLLGAWARSADNKDEQLLRFKAIESCVEKITDPDANEELSYWSQKWSAVFLDDSNYNNATYLSTALSIGLDTLDTVSPPSELHPYMETKEFWILSSEFSLSDVPGFIYVSTLNKLDARTQITIIQHALQQLSWWVFSTREVKTRQERLTAIKKSIDLLITPSTRQEVAYWFKKSLSSCLFHGQHTAPTIVLLLENGAYSKSCNITGDTLFYSSSLDEMLFAKLTKAGLNPEEKNNVNATPLVWAIFNKAKIPLNTLWRHGVNIYERDENGTNVCVQVAIKANNTYALRKLLLKGVSIDKGANGYTTPMDFLIKEGAKGRKQAFYLLLGQQPRELPVAPIPAIAYAPDPYNDFINIKDHKDIEEQLKNLGEDARESLLKKNESKKLKEWLYTYADYTHGQKPLAFTFFGDQQQFKNGIARLIKNRMRYAQMSKTKMSPDDLHVAGYYSALLLTALRHCAKNLFTLLSLCVQEHVIQIKVTETACTITLNDGVTHDKELKKRFAKAVRKYLPYYPKYFIHAACAPGCFQENLYKIVMQYEKKYGGPEELPNTKKALQKILDVKIKLYRIPKKYPTVVTLQFNATSENEKTNFFDDIGFSFEN